MDFPFQCKPVWCVATPAVGVGGPVRLSEASSRRRLRLGLRGYRRAPMRDVIDSDIDSDADLEKGSESERGNALDDVQMRLPCPPHWGRGSFVC